MLGFVFRLSSLAFVLSYWYLFLLDKSRWNNHSYLFGLTGTLLMVSGANRYWYILYTYPTDLRKLKPLHDYALISPAIVIYSILALNIQK